MRHRRCSGTPRCSSSRIRLLIIPALAFVLTAPSGCRESRLASVTEAVLDGAITKAELQGLDIPNREDIRVLLYEHELSAGQTVFSALPGEVDPMRCDNTCWLFFVDFHPDAHFAHPTAIGLYDRGNNLFAWDHEFEIRIANWWPAISDSSDSQPVSIFSTYAARSDEERIVHPRPGGISNKVWPGLATEYTTRVRVVPHRIPLWTTADAYRGDPGRWAFIVQGYADRPFVTNVERAQTVAAGLGFGARKTWVVSPESILPPDPPPAGEDPRSQDGIGEDADEESDANRPAPSSENKCLQRLRLARESLLERIQWSGDCDEVLVYVTSHGKPAEEDGIVCNHETDKVSKHFWTAGELEEFLKTLGPNSRPEVICDRVTVILESCYSGSYVPAMVSGLNGVDSVVVTSSAADKISYVDLDSIRDANEGDLGSEFSSGFWEAYGREIADAGTATSKDHRIGVAEAFDYAQRLDYAVTQNNSIPTFTDGTTPPVYKNQLLSISGGAVSGSLATISIDQVHMTNELGIAGELLSGGANKVLVTFRNTSGREIPVATVRVMVKQTSGLLREVNGTEILSRVMAGRPFHVVISWTQPATHAVGATTDLCVEVDSPALGSGKAVSKCLTNVPVVAAPTPTPTPTPTPCQGWLCACRTQR
jgi:hypothetical protein